MEASGIDRRVTAAELAGLLNVGPAWLRELERRGKIPAANRDPGSRRKWWPASVARAIVQGQPPQQPAS